MDRLKVESKSSSGKWVVGGSCLLIFASLFVTRIVASAPEGVPVEGVVAGSFADLSDENSLFHEAYTTWNCNHQFEASQKLYRRLFAKGAGKPFMHVAYADMLVENNQKEEALKEYRLGFVATGTTAEASEHLVLARYAKLCRSAHQDTEADWAERQLQYGTVAGLRDETSISASSAKPMR